MCRVPEAHCTTCCRLHAACCVSCNELQCFSKTAWTSLAGHATPDPLQPTHHMQKLISMDPKNQVTATCLKLHICNADRTRQRPGNVASTVSMTGRTPCCRRINAVCNIACSTVPPRPDTWRRNPLTHLHMFNWQHTHASCSFKPILPSNILCQEGCFM
jgi:hypothetical protein